MVSETNTYSDISPAASTLVDNEKEGDLGNGTWSVWAGASGRSASFVVDLGCETVVTKIDLRNAIK